MSDQNSPAKPAGEKPPADKGAAKANPSTPKGTAAKSGKLKAQSAAPAKHTSGSGAGKWWLLILVLLAAASAAGYYYGAPLWQQFNGEQQALARQVQALEVELAKQSQQQLNSVQQIAANNEKIENLPLRLSTELSGQLNQQLQRQITGPMASLASRVQRNQTRLNDLDGGVGRQWQLAELQYTIRLASMRLTLEDDVAPSIELLERADDLLAQWNDPDFSPLRAALAADIAALEQRPTIDRQGLHNRLLAIAVESQEALATELERQNFVLQEEGAEDQGARPDWRARLNQLGDLVGELFILQRTEQALPELTAPNAQQLLAERFALAIEQAALAMWRGDTALYQHSLKLCQELLELSTASSDNRAPLRASLAELAQLPVAHKTLSISQSEAAWYDWQRANAQSESAP